MSPKRSPLQLGPPPPRSLFIPGKETILEAWNILVFSTAFALLFNAFYTDGIELKYKPEKKPSLQNILNSNPAGNPSTEAPAGWNISPVPKSKADVHSQAQNPPADSIPRITLIGAKKRFDGKKAVFLDARKPGEYQEGHIPGALNFFANEMDKFAPLVLPQLPDKNQDLVCYCSGGDCDLSLEVAQSLMAQGYQHVEVYQGGWPDWKKAGYPAHKGERP